MTNTTPPTSDAIAQIPRYRLVRQEDGNYVGFELVLDPKGPLCRFTELERTAFYAEIVTDAREIAAQPGEGDSALAQAFREFAEAEAGSEGIMEDAIYDIKKRAREIANKFSITSSVEGEAGERLEILRRICQRGRNYFLDKSDSTGIDLFEHMETEVHWLKSSLNQSAPPHVADALDGERLEFLANYGVAIRQDPIAPEHWFLVAIFHTGIPSVDDKRRYPSFREAIDAARAEAGVK